MSDDIYDHVAEKLQEICMQIAPEHRMEEVKGWVYAIKEESSPLKKLMESIDLLRAVAKEIG